MESKLNRIEQHITKGGVAMTKAGLWPYRLYELSPSYCMSVHKSVIPQPHASFDHDDTAPLTSESLIQFKKNNLEFDGG